MDYESHHFSLKMRVVLKSKQDILSSNPFQFAFLLNSSKNCWLEQQTLLSDIAI